MRIPDPGLLAFAGASIAVLAASPAAAGDLVSENFRLRGANVAASGPARLWSTAVDPTIMQSGVSSGQSEAIGWGLPAAGLAASWPGFWPRISGTFPNQDLDQDGVPNLVDLDDDGDGAPDLAEIAGLGSDPLDPDTDDDGLCDGPPSALPACAQGGEDLDGDGVYDVGVETDPTNPDTDGDGFDDRMEGLAGSNPLDPNSVPRFVDVPALGAPGIGLLLVALAGFGIARLRRRNRT